MCDYEKKSHRKGKEKNRTKDKTKYIYTQKHVRATLQNNQKKPKIINPNIEHYIK